MINLNHKKFVLLSNSEKGTVNTDTIFEYQQYDNLIIANYKGGFIKYGKIIGKLLEDKIDMLYQCLNVDDELLAGKAIAIVTKTKEDKIKLSLNWQWISGKEGSGTSEYIEIKT